MIFRRGGFWLAGLSCAVTLGACMGVSSDVGSMDGDGGQGAECEEGAMKPAGDGCNTCTCDADGTWGCTELACECQEGAMKPAGDGCNTCTCGPDGSWSCTLLDCAECTDGETRPAGDGCNTCICSGGEWGCTLQECNECALGDTRSDGCGSCFCTELGGRLTWACTANMCPTCEAGETKPAGDGCNTCTCTMEGTWSCTDMACQACMQGETRPAGDGCNTCMCYNGTWGCTMALCEPLVCDEGQADCDGDAANGCETNLATDFMNCGSCGYYCGVPRAVAACEAGQCAVDSCDAGYADCNGNAVDGCEAPVGNGGCEELCNVPTMVTEPVPAEGTCECPAGMACVRGSIEDEDADSEYCFPIPEGCADGFATCGCMSACVCPGGSDMACYDQMALGGVFILNCPGQQP